MNEVTLFEKGNLPARFQNREVDETTKALAGGMSAGHRLSIKGGVFRMMSSGKQIAENTDRAMNIVVVAAAPTVNRQYYEGAYEEGVAVSPTCWSADGKTPNADSTKPQARSCDSCPQNIAGSGQGESRACRYQQRLAVVLEGDLDGVVYQLPLPATSLFGKGEINNTKLPLQAYARFLAQNGAPITEVVTEMRFDTNSATPKLTFKAVRILTDEESAITKAQGETSEAKLAVTLSVSKQDGVKTAKTTAAPATVSEPTIASSATKAITPTTKRPVSEVIAEWDD